MDDRELDQRLTNIEKMLVAICKHDGLIEEPKEENKDKPTKEDKQYVGQR